MYRELRGAVQPWQAAPMARLAGLEAWHHLQPGRRKSQIANRR
jgi:hypothetical protein